MKKTIFLFSILLLFIKCKDDRNKIIIDKFEHSTSLRGDSVFNAIDPKYIDIIDTVMIIWNEHEDGYFQLYNLNTYDYIKTFAKKGKGPGEVIFPFYYGQHEIKNDSTLFWVTDIRAQRVCVYSLNKLLNSNKDIPISKLYFPMELDNVQHAFITDKKIIASSFRGSKLSRMLQYNLDTKSVLSNNFITDHKYEAYQDNLPLVAWSNNRIKPDYTKIVSALSFFKQIDIFDVATNKHELCIDFNMTEIPDFKKGVSKYYYVDIEVTNKHIYALCLNHKYVDKQESGVEIQVFSWKGKALCNFTVSESIKSIAIDVNNNAIYGSDLYACTVYKYKIPKDVLIMQ